MRKIETTSWQKFKIGALFPNIIKPIVYHSYEVDKDDEGIPYVVRSKFDNGIKYRVKKSSLQTSPAGVISFGAENSTFFYQEEEWCSGRDIYYIDTRDIPSYACKFLLTCLCKITARYSYNYGLFPDLLKEEYVYLPVSSKNIPDWNYMEHYMKQVELFTSNHISSIISLSQLPNRKKIDTNKWSRFHLYDENLFSIDMGTKLDKVKMTSNNPSVNFVGRANANNGVTDYIDKIEGLEPYEAGCLTISLGGEYLGSCFIQEKPFYTSQNVNVLIPKHPMSDYCKRFICTMVFREGRLRYKAFVDELNRHMKTDFSILLPVSKDNRPDWKYMEDYMRRIENKTKTYVNSISTLIRH